MGKKTIIQPIDIGLFISRFIEVAEKAKAGKDTVSLAIFNKGNKFQKIVHGAESMNIPTFNKAILALDYIEAKGLKDFIANKQQSARCPASPTQAPEEETL
jgi:hypothetical protein